MVQTPGHNCLMMFYGCKNVSCDPCYWPNPLTGLPDYVYCKALSCRIFLLMSECDSVVDNF